MALKKLILLGLAAVLASCSWLWPQASSPMPAKKNVLIVGGAGHTQLGLGQKRVDDFFLTVALESAEALALATEREGYKTGRLITQSPMPNAQYQELLGASLAACNCRTLIQVNFGKNLQRQPQTFLFTYELMQLVPSSTMRPGYETTVLTSSWKKTFEYPITEEGMKTANPTDLAKAVVAELVAKKLLLQE